MMPKTRRNAGRCTTAARTLLAFAVLLTGCSPPGDDSEVSRALRSSAEQGDAEAQFDLGLMYALGDGVAQDDAEAVRWYRLAAEQGHAPAQYSLGAMYAMGEGVTQDYVLAHTWCSLAASGASDVQTRDVAVFTRDEAARQMTPEQITEAQRRAREWTENHRQDDRENVGASQD